MNIHIIYRAAFLLFFCGLSGLAQQSPRYSLYSLAPSTINAAHVGEYDGLALTTVYRSQWANIDGAPKTFSLVGEQRFGRRHGLGLSFVNDRIGPTQTSQIRADFSYAVPISDVTELRLGLNVSGSFFELNPNGLNPADGEVQFMETVSSFNPNVGIGALLVHDRWYLGLSAPVLFDNEVETEEEAIVLANTLQFYVTTGYTISLNERWELRPALLYSKNTIDSGFFDVSASFKYNQKLWFGASYRLNIGVGGVIGFNISDRLGFAYAYDKDNSSIGDFANGSHELGLRLKLGANSESRVFTRN